MITEQDSKVISSLRLPLAIMVVAIHSFISIEGWSYEDVAIQGAGSNTAAFFMIAFSHVLCHVAVPTFFLISGFLFFSNFGDGSRYVWKRKLLSRTKTLLLPYLLWNVLYILWMMCWDVRGVMDAGMLVWLQEKGGLSMLWSSNHWNLDRVDLWGNPDIASSPILVPFWFMRDLIVCVFLTPLFWLVFKKQNAKWVKVVGASILVILYFTQTSFGIPGLSSNALFYFGIGTALSINEAGICNTIGKWRIPGYLLFGILFIVEVCLFGHNTFWGNIIYPFYVFAGVVTIINVFSRVKFVNWGGQKYTFFIFAFHIFILSIVGSILSKSASWITGSTIINDLAFADKYPIIVILEYVLKIAITLIVTILVYTVLEKISPRLCKLLCGR